MGMGMRTAGWKSGYLFGPCLATEDREFTESIFLLASMGRPALQPLWFQMGKGMRLCSR